MPRLRSTRAAPSSDRPRGHAERLGVRLLGCRGEKSIYEPGGLLKGRFPRLIRARRRGFIREPPSRLRPPASPWLTTHPGSAGRGCRGASRLGERPDHSPAPRRLRRSRFFCGRREDAGARFIHAGVKIVIEEGSAPEEIADAVETADRAGAQIALHAVEGGSLVIALDALRRLGAERVRRRRHRIEHAALCPRRLSEEIAARRRDGGHAPRLSPSLRREIRERARARGARLPSTLEEPSRRRGACGARFRRPDRALPGLSREWRLPPARSPREARISAARRRSSVAQALVAPYLRRALRLPGSTGCSARSSPGQLADLVLLDADPVTIPPDEVASIDVRATVVGRRSRVARVSDFRTIVFDRQGPVASITLNRPQLLNAYNTEMRDDLSSRAIDDPCRSYGAGGRSAGQRSRVLLGRGHPRVRFGAVAGRRSRSSLAARRLGPAALASAADDRGDSWPRGRERPRDGAALRLPHRRHATRYSRYRRRASA